MKKVKIITTMLLLFLVSAAPTYATSFIWPVSFSYVSTYFSSWHPGVDLVAPCGTPIHSTSYGVVQFDGWDTTGYGNRIDVYKADTDDLARYAHLSELDVTSGQAVGQGQQIGLVGTSGNSTGCHLHFELHWHNMAVDPFGSI